MKNQNEYTFQQGKLSRQTRLDYVSSSQELDLFSNLEDQIEEEVAEAMTKPTMEEYMTKTREDYGSGIARPKIDEKAHFKWKGQFLKEIHDNTFSGSDNKDDNEHIEKLRNEPSSSIDTWETLKKKFLSKYCPPARTAKKMEEINNFQQVPDETLYQAWEQFKELLLRCLQHYLMDIQEVVLFYKGLDVPTRQILDSKAAIQAQLNNLGKEIEKVNEKVYAAQGERNQVEDLSPTVKEGEEIDEPMEDIVKTRNDEISKGIKEYPSFCNYDEKIHVDCAYNLQFSCMIGFEHVNANFFLILSINVMSKKFYNSIMKDKIEYEGKNVVGAFINVPIVVGNFSVATNFAVIENMDAYRDEGMSDIIVGKPFCRKIYVKARRFDGMITIYNGNNNVTYQMALSHPRFKHLTNSQCNKMRPLLKVSARDKLNGISHPYQKLNSLYKGVLNLGPEYIRDAKIEELLTHGHVSIHEME
ncbi:homeodomain-like protein [Tanacetum coccineum]